ncbi:hypothetical protein JX265_009862 [Neoarthrinium moseri]|uniref:Uncharacterized protein n=1 Tax=Neoarthrinium moseri TaxID=1658444 RepID=A0A9Q0AL56_9PEZI|nr:hypothetical protein JX265_009862 [Neoarthrinium moseri]
MDPFNPQNFNDWVNLDGNDSALPNEFDFFNIPDSEQNAEVLGVPMAEAHTEESIAAEYPANLTSSPEYSMSGLDSGLNNDQANNLQQTTASGNVPPVATPNNLEAPHFDGLQDFSVQRPPFLNRPRVEQAPSPLNDVAGIEAAAPESSGTGDERQTPPEKSKQQMRYERKCRKQEECRRGREAKEAQNRQNFQQPRQFPVRAPVRTPNITRTPIASRHRAGPPRPRQHQSRRAFGHRMAADDAVAEMNQHGYTFPVPASDPYSGRPRHPTPQLDGASGLDHIRTSPPLGAPAAETVASSEPTQNVWQMGFGQQAMGNLPSQQFVFGPIPQGPASAQGFPIQAGSVLPQFAHTPLGGQSPGFLNVGAQHQGLFQQQAQAAPPLLSPWLQLGLQQNASINTSNMLNGNGIATPFPVQPLLGYTNGTQVPFVPAPGNTAGQAAPAVAPMNPFNGMELDPMLGQVPNIPAQSLSNDPMVQGLANTQQPVPDNLMPQNGQGSATEIPDQADNQVAPSPDAQSQDGQDEQPAPRSSPAPLSQAELDMEELNERISSAHEAAMRSVEQPNGSIVGPTPPFTPAPRAMNPGQMATASTSGPSVGEQPGRPSDQGEASRSQSRPQATRETETPAPAAQVNGLGRRLRSIALNEQVAERNHHGLNALQSRAGVRPDHHHHQYPRATPSEPFPVRPALGEVRGVHRAHGLDGANTLHGVARRTNNGTVRPADLMIGPNPRDLWAGAEAATSSYHEGLEQRGLDNFGFAAGDFEVLANEEGPMDSGLDEEPNENDWTSM